MTTTEPTTDMVTFAAFEYPANLPAEVDELLGRLEALTESVRPLLADVWRMWRRLEAVNDSLLSDGFLDWDQFLHMLDIAGIKATKVNDLMIGLADLVDAPGSTTLEVVAAMGVTSEEYDARVVAPRMRAIAGHALGEMPDA